MMIFCWNRVPFHILPVLVTAKAQFELSLLVSLGIVWRPTFPTFFLFKLLWNLCSSYSILSRGDLILLTWLKHIIWFLCLPVFVVFGGGVGVYMCVCVHACVFVFIKPWYFKVVLCAVIGILNANVDQAGVSGQLDDPEYHFYDFDFLFWNHLKLSRKWQDSYRELPPTCHWRFINH